ncbi:DNA-binding transcriptional regulator, MarR family [Methylobacterium gossipiicola]|uniref:DNA-binding transcriptional regulator, MarR family n=2 Tax=Methylobacterium gossipiicola TaxID=582675 RepID=A0A1I2S3S2_9HYPH|nr:DNA-binding transcriptional regulator, MarR family [Methylobacterium gossipiicola]
MQVVDERCSLGATPGYAPSPGHPSHLLSLPRDDERTMSKADKRNRATGSKDQPDSKGSTTSKTVPGSKSVGWALVQAARLHRSRVGDRLAALDLFAGQEQVVQALAASGTMTMGDLAATLRVRPPTASKTISRLAALGFVERRAEAGDGRIVRVRLTEMGLAKAEAIERIGEDVEAELLAGFEGKERRRLRKLLRKAARNLAEVSGALGHEVEGDAEIDEEEGEGETDEIAAAL